jgi:hypothetical protein
MKNFTREDSLKFQEVIPMRDPLMVVELPEGEAVLRKSLTPVKRYNPETGLFDSYEAKRRYVPKGETEC